MKTFIKLLKTEEGSTAIEYALIVTLIAVVCIASMNAVGGKLQAAFTTVSTAL